MGDELFLKQQNEQSPGYYRLFFPFPFPVLVALSQGRGASNQACMIVVADFDWTELISFQIFFPDGEEN